MNCRRPIKTKELSEEVFNDIARIRQIWQECRTRFGGEGSWLLGRFSILDAMYAPVALRFHTYQLAAGDVEQDYVNTVLTHSAIQEWIEAGKQETEVIQAFED